MFTPFQLLWHLLLYLFNICLMVIVFIWNFIVSIFDKWHETSAAKAALVDYERFVRESDFTERKRSISERIRALCESLDNGQSMHIPRANLVVSAGAANNIYAWGAVMVCNELDIKIESAAGASSGALMALLAISDGCTNIMDTILFDTVACTLPSVWRNLPFLCLGPVYRRAIELLMETVPLPTDDRLFITVTNYFRARYISRFDSKKELVNVLMDTALIPAITGFPRFSHRHVSEGRMQTSNDRVSFHMDGGFTDLAPISAIPETCIFPTIVINPLWSDLSVWQYIKRGLFPSVDDLEKSIMLGAMDMIKLLESHETSVKGIEIVQKKHKTVCAGSGLHDA